MRRRDFVGWVGSAALWPALARAQQPASSIGLLAVTDIAPWAMEAFRKGLDEAGYAEGRNLTTISRSAGGQIDRLPALAADLVENRVSAIFTTGGPIPTRAAKATTASIPIVFAYGGDPVADGLVASFNRPGGTVTGATFVASALSAKRLEFLREVAPQAGAIALLVNPKGTLAEAQIRDADTATRTLGLHLHVLNASSDREIDDAFAAISRLKIDALLVSVDPLFAFSFSEKIVALANRYGAPSIYDSRTYVGPGGLMSYGPLLPDTWRQAGVYIGRVLKGERPADLPIVQATKFELVINLKTAKALGLEIPSKLLFTADYVIE
jgi:putative ABC transport system substrate-binding protein